MARESRTETPKDEVQSQTGEPAEQTSTGASEQASETESTGRKAEEIDLSTEFVIDKAGNKATLNDILQGFHQSRRLIQRESEFDRNKNEMLALQEQNKQLQDTLAGIERDTAIMASIKKLGLQKESKDVDSESDWLTGEDNQPTLDPKAVLQQLNSMRQQDQEELRKVFGIGDGQLPDLDALVDQKIAQREVEREKQLARNTFAQNLRTTQMAQLRKEYGLAMSDDEIRDVVNKLDLSRALTAQAGDLAQSWDKESQDAAIENQTQAAKLQMSALETLKAATIEQEKKAREAELEQALETGQFPGLTKAETDDLAEGLNLNLPKDLKTYRKRVVEAEAAKLDAVDAARKSLGR